jgi:N-acetylmuramic acid 6-phosphate etherase
MKAGTAQKLVLNMLSTGLMVEMGYVFGNLMIHIGPSNQKLAARARRIVAAIAGCGAREAAAALLEAENDVRVAVVMGRRRIGAEEARAVLSRAGNDLRRALGD